MRRWIVYAVLLIFAAGCIKPVQNVGCCLKESVDEGGCILYNTTDQTTHEEYIELTIGDCNSTEQNTEDHCRVLLTIGDEEITEEEMEEEGVLIPLCTEDPLAGCINPECTAMVCGDFKYKPRFVPGFTSVEDSEGNVPPDVGDEATLNFHNAQCRFLPLDNRLKQVMKNSKSQINVFRMGVGGSFDEFDQYRYFFPMSDQFSAANPDGEVDRYMNYLSWETGEASEFDPGDLEENCIDDDDIPGPFQFSEESEPRESTHEEVGEFEYEPVVPDDSNYKFAHHARMDKMASYVDSHGGYYNYITPDDIWQIGIYKKIDEGFYKRELAIAHQGDIFGEDGSTRAPFECSSGDDCLSGVCDARVYNRGVSIEYMEDDVGEETEIVTDCNVLPDENGQSKVICSPTTSIWEGSSGHPPGLISAYVNITPARISTPMNYYTYTSLTQDIDPILEDWDEFAEMEASHIGKSKSYTRSASQLTFDEDVRYADCNDYDISEESSYADITGLCSNMTQTYADPPIGGVTFFGKVDDREIRMPDGSVIIGYALAKPSQFDNILFVDRCNLSFDISSPYENNMFMFGLETAACTSYCEQRFANPSCYFDPQRQNYYSSEAACIAAHQSQEAEFMDRCTDGLLWSRAECYQECAEAIGHADNICVQNCLEYEDEAAVELCGTFGEEYDEAFDECHSQCIHHCTYVDSAKCNDFCEDGDFDQIIIITDPDNPPPVPSCFIPGEDPDNTLVSDDFYRVDFEDGPGSPVWQTMMSVFKPYFQDRVENGIMSTGFSDGCGDFLNSGDAVVSSIPWVVNYEKKIWSDNELILQSLHLSSTSAQALRERNLFDRPVIDIPGTSSCELRRDTMHPGVLALSGGDATQVHNIGYSENIYLFRYVPGSGRIGDCAVDDTTYLPVVKTFGWCEASTTSTLAFQEISANDRVYMPAYTANVEDDEFEDLQSICEIKYEYEFEGGGIEYSDNVSCFNPYISDIDDYKESIGGIGSPRTIPEASILKERMGNYMKSGILPVIDMSNETNWDRTNPDGGSGFSLWWFDIDFGSEDEYLQYDFENLFGQMGALVTIVDHVDEDNAADKTDQIISRSSIVRSKCFGCLTAIHVDSPEDNESFRETVQDALGDPRARLNVDMVTFDYPISEHEEFTTPEEVANDLASYGRVSLETVGKPVMVVGLNVDTYDGIWSGSEYDDLFTAIVENQDELIQSGTVGIIYSPARDSFGGLGIVDVIGGEGTKTVKFCALQGAMQRMSASQPIAIYSKILAQDNATCVPCTSLDQYREEGCNMECDNGVECLLPEGVSQSESGGYKCPANTVVDECQLCSEVGGEYTCTIRYANGTIVETEPQQMSDITSDIYLDIIGGFAKPDKCCLEDSMGMRYSYAKQSYSAPINKPLVFPKTGDENADCGVADAGDIEGVTTFCGIENIPVKDYDIECTLS